VGDVRAFSFWCLFFRYRNVGGLDVHLRPPEMKAPRCRLCGKEHYGLCPSGSLIPASKSEGRNEAKKSAPASTTPPQEIERATSQSGPLTPAQKTVRPDVENHVSETIPEKFYRKAAELGFRKLTQAEKQKKYREKGGAGLRERERLRMAAKRKELRDALRDP